MTSLHQDRFRLHLYVIPPLPHPWEYGVSPGKTRVDRTTSGRVADDPSEPVERGVPAEPCRPPLLLRRLRRTRVHAAATFARLVFVLPSPPPLCWNGSHCWLDCFSPRLEGICEPIFADAADLMSALPGIQEWLDNWENSGDRAPSTDPRWALERQINPAVVERIARAILQQLSTNRRRKLAFYTATGERACLTIPPRESLVLPPIATCLQHAEHITGKEEFAICATPTGEEVFIAADLAAHLPNRVPVDVRMLREFRMTSATSIQPVADTAGDSRDEG